MVQPSNDDKYPAVEGTARRRHKGAHAWIAAHEEMIRADIQAMGCKEVADKHGIPVSTISTLRRRWYPELIGTKPTKRKRRSSKPERPPREAKSASPETAREKSVAVDTIDYLRGWQAGMREGLAAMASK